MFQLRRGPAGRYVPFQFRTRIYKTGEVYAQIMCRSDRHCDRWRDDCRPHILSRSGEPDRKVQETRSLGQGHVCSSCAKLRFQCYAATALFVALLSFACAASGQLFTDPSTAKDSGHSPNAEPPQDPLGRTTPRGTVLGFLSAAYSHKYNTAAQYLDTRATGQDSENLAKQLFVVLDRKLPAKLNSVSNEPLGSLSDPVDAKREFIGSVMLDKNSSVDIYLVRVDRKNAASIWLFSRQTLVDIPDVYHQINPTTVDNLLPDFLLKKFFRISLFGWGFYFVLLPLIYVLLSVLNRLISSGVGYAIQRWTHSSTRLEVAILPHPLRFVILSCTVYIALQKFSFSLFARQVSSTIAVLLLIVAFVWAMFLVNAWCEIYVKKRMESRGRLSATAILRPARRVLDLIAIIVGLMFLLHALGIDSTATLAGLGVGGIAVALAAQKTLENVIGGVSLIMDGVARVGDFFKIGDVMGTIEVIGLRSTRVRTLERTVVTIPNGQMASMTLENFSARDQFWLKHLIGVDYGTSPEKLNLILAQVGSLLQKDARVLPFTSRVRFLRFAESSLELEVVAYLAARDWNHFLEIQEELLMKIRELVGAAGVDFAFPSRTIYLKSESAGVWLQSTPHEAVSAKETIDDMQRL